MSTARERGLSKALEIQRRTEPRAWRAAVDAIEDVEERRVAEEYLRSMIERTKIVAALRREGGR